jgi:hypothetical protein
MRDRTRRSSTAASLTACAALLLVACGGSTESGAVDTAATVSTEAAAATDPPATDPPATDPPATDPPATDPPATDPPATDPPATDPPATDPPATDPPTGPLTPADLVLRPSGIGPFDFGAISTADFIAAVTPALGAPSGLTSDTYPTAVGSRFENADELAFAFPFSDTACFANALCAHFGGASAADLDLVGYVQDENAAALATASGVTSGSVWASYSGVITVEEGGCFSIGYGRADGVGIVVQSSGIPFIDIQPDGTFVTQVPPQAAVSVLSLNSGDQPIFIFADC